MWKEIYNGKPMTADEAREAMRGPYAFPFMAGLIELVKGCAWIARGLFMAALSLFGVVLQVAAWAVSARTPDPKRFAPKYVPSWYDGKAQPVDVPDDGEFFQTKRGGFPNVFDAKGLRYEGLGVETPAEQAGAAALKDNGITPEEYGEMLAHRPKLTNVVLAGMIKRHLKEGKTLKEIAVLCNVGEQYVKFFSACFTRANKKPNAYEVDF